MIHMKGHDLFSMKNKKNWNVGLLQILLDTFRFNYFCLAAQIAIFVILTLQIRERVFSVWGLTQILEVLSCLISIHDLKGYRNYSISLDKVIFLTYKHSYVFNL